METEQNQQQQQERSDDDLWKEVAQQRGQADEQTQAGSEAAAQQETQPGDEAQTDATQAGQTTGKQDDPLAGLPEPTRKYFEDLQAKVNAQDERLRSQGQQLAKANGTIGGLKQQLDASQAKLQQITPTVDAVAAEKKVAEEQRRKEIEARKKELREQFSEIPGLNEYLDLIVVGADAQPAKADSTRGKPEQREQQSQAGSEWQQRTQADANAGADEPPETERLQLQLELTKRHPDWMDISKTDEFKTWAKAQSAEVKAKIGAWDVEAADAVFKKFKKDQEDAAKIARVEAERQERLRRGSTIQGRGSATTGSDASSTDATWEKVKRDREQARATP